MGAGRFCTLWLLCIVAVWSNTEHRRVDRSSINVVQLSSRLFMEAHGKSSIQDHTSRKRWSLSSARRTTRLGKCYHRSGHRSGHRGKASTELFARRGPKPGVSNAAKSAYVHVPFCRRRCFYCDFAISVVGDKKTTWESRHDTYLHALRREIKATPQELGNELETVFFGGGTPSLAPPQFIADVLTELDARYGISTSAEISMEMDPVQRIMSEAKHEDNYGRDVSFWSDEHFIYLGTFDLEKLQGYLVAGINRVSLGVQVFDDRLLSSIGRSHSLQDVYNAIQILRRAGVENFSIDLISGLPNQTLNDWKETIEAALSFDPPHIAVYDLMVEQKTAFDKWGYVPGLSPLPSEKDSTNMYRYASNTLQQEGFKHYEISNYAKSGFECQHNRVYWENKPFLAFGMGAASYLQGFRFSRPRKLDDYLLFVNEELRSCEDWTNYMQRVRENASQLHHPNLEELTDKVMLGLRLREGLDMESIGIHYGTNVVDSILEGAQTAITMGHAKVEIDPNSGNIQRLRLVDPDGFMISSEIIANIFSYLN